MLHLIAFIIGLQTFLLMFNYGFRGWAIVISTLALILSYVMMEIQFYIERNRK